jgi:hypothetical protein
MKHGIIENGIKGPFSLKKVNVWNVPLPPKHSGGISMSLANRSFDLLARWCPIEI